MPIAEELRSAADDLLGSLDRAQRVVVQRPFEIAGERQRWFYTPTDHGGLLFSAMSPTQHQAADMLIGAGLSEGGYNTAQAVMALESILDHGERWRGRPHFRPRDPLRYALTIFGAPSDDVWGWRVGGHHLSLNFTIVGQTVAATPCFMGADPSTAPLLGDDVYAPLAGAEAVARDIVRSMNDEERSSAVLSPRSPWDLALSNRSQPETGATPRKLYEIFRDDPDVMRPIVERAQDEIETKLGTKRSDIDSIAYTARPKGVPVGRLAHEQRDSVERLVRHYVGRLSDEISDRMVGENPVDSLHLAWAGDLEPGASHYYRIHGPALLVEYVNVVRERGHIHAVLRDPRGDFGIRLLD